MAQANPNIFNPGQANEGADDNQEYTGNEFELTDDDTRNKIRANIYKALTNEENEESLDDKKYPPGTLTQLLEEELINEFQKAENTTYKNAANNVVKRLSGTRFAEARRQLSDGEYSFKEFIKGKTPKPQRKAQTSRGDTSPQKLQGTRPSGPVDRNRGVRPPPFANRGAPPSRGARGGPRGARGGRGMPPIRGGLNQATGPTPAPPMQSRPSESNQEEQEDENNEETKQQPAIQVPIENNKEQEAKENSPEANEEAESKEKSNNDNTVIPPMRQAEKQESVEAPASAGSNQEQKNAQGAPPMMPKTSHRRGQPAPGNHNAPPPMANRGRMTRGAPPLGRGGRTPNFNQRPLPNQNQVDPVDRIEIVEEEIVHESEVKEEHVHEPHGSKQPQKQPDQPHPAPKPQSRQQESPRKDSGDKINFIENKDYEESENKKREAKAMFGKLFENDGSEKGDRTRGRSPNFSDQRHRKSSNDTSEERKRKSKKSQNKRPKTQRINNDLNKSVEIFGMNENQIETDNPENANNALNTSFGIENASDLNDMTGGDDEHQNTSKLFGQHENDANLSKTPPVDIRRKEMEEMSQEEGGYHQPIGAKEDFTIEKPVLEPPRDDSYTNEDQSVKTPDMKSDEGEETLSQFMKREQDTVQKSIPTREKGNVLKVADSTKTEFDPPQPPRKKNRYALEEEKRPGKSNDRTESSINNIEDGMRITYTPAASTAGEGGYLRSMSASKYDQTVPISHTSSVKSIPDETERLTENLKSK